MFNGRANNKLFFSEELKDYAGILDIATLGTYRYNNQFKGSIVYITKIKVSVSGTALVNSDTKYFGDTSLTQDSILTIKGISQTREIFRGRNSFDVLSKADQIFNNSTDFLHIVFKNLEMELDDHSSVEFHLPSTLTNSTLKIVVDGYRLQN